MQHEKISKIDAARRQLVEAIRMFFERRDQIAIHTVTCASYQILLDLRDEYEKNSLLYYCEYIRPEKRQEFISILRKAQNFFKHSKSDPNEILDFNINEKELALFDSCYLYSILYSDSFNNIVEMKLFLSWFIAKNPFILKEGQAKNKIYEFYKGKDLNDFEYITNLFYLSALK